MPSDYRRFPGIRTVIGQSNDPSRASASPGTAHPLDRREWRLHAAMSRSATCPGRARGDLWSSRAAMLFASLNRRVSAVQTERAEFNAEGGPRERLAADAAREELRDRRRAEHRGGSLAAQRSEIEPVRGDEPGAAVETRDRFEARTGGTP